MSRKNRFRLSFFGALALGIPRKKLYLRMRKFAIDKELFDGDQA